MIKPSNRLPPIRLAWMPVSWTSSMLAVITTTKDERHFALRKTTGFVLSKTCLVAANQSEAPPGRALYR